MVEGSECRVAFYFSYILARYGSVLGYAFLLLPLLFSPFVFISAPSGLHLYDGLNHGVLNWTLDD